MFVMPALEKWGEEDSWGPLASQASLTQEPQVLVKKIMSK